MNRIVATRGDTNKKLLQTGAPLLPPTVTAPATVVDSDTDQPVLVTTKYPGDLQDYRRAILGYPMDTTVRSGGIRNTSRVFGYVGRNRLLQRNSCRVCGAALETPGAHQVIAGAAEHLARQLEQHAPERAANDAAIVHSGVLPEWRMHPQSWWTSGVVNRTSPLPYHYDANNFDVWSAMTVIRRGVRGGHLHIPEYDITVACRDGDVVYFNGSKLMHGVTPMWKTSDDGYRFSAVYYAVRNMRHCRPAAEELAEGCEARSTAEDGLLDRQRTSGAITPSEL